MKYFELTQEEQEILEAYERGELKTVSNAKAIKADAKEAAQNTLNKTMNINIRLTQKTLAKLKRKAAEEGIPYQTLVSSILHKSVK